MIEREAANFLSRWSRLKRSGGDTAPATSAALAEPVGPLPDVATLQFSDDFSRFLHDEVEEGVKRLALKKLFHSPVFNVMDGLDTYIDDYGIPDPIDDVMLKGLAHAQGLIFDIEPSVKAEPAGTEVVTPSLAVTNDMAAASSGNIDVASMPESARA